MGVMLGIRGSPSSPRWDRDQETKSELSSLSDLRWTEVVQGWGWTWSNSGI